MSFQAILVGICVLAAVIFMGRKFYRTLRRGGGCSCDCDSDCKTRECAGGGTCQKNLTELKPK